MEVLFIDREYTPGDVFHITPYSDLHDDAVACDHALLKSHMERRAALPNAVFVGIGDTGNWIMPGPDRRHQPSTPLPELAVRDDYIDAAVELQAQRYSGYPWAFFGLGNHETAIIAHHHTDPVRRLCEKLNVPWAGYSGMARFRFRNKGAEGADCTFTLLYHHGAWGGKVQKGFGGARDFARAFEGWDCFVYGHNHQLNVHQEPRVDATQRGRLRSREVFFVNTGTFQKGMQQGEMPAYSEIKGYAPVSLACPLIKVRPGKQEDMKVSVETGDC